MGLFHSLNKTFRSSGIDLKILFTTIRRFPRFIRDLFRYRRQQKSGSSDFRVKGIFPYLNDHDSESGVSGGHYFYQDWLVAGRIYQNSPEIHVDVGSRVDGLITHIASFRPVTVIDIRPLSTNIPNIEFIQMDITGSISSSFTEFCDSLSCLHALEHFGLGRYGGEINYEGYLTGLKNLAKLLKTGGKFYLSIPIGPQRVEFNAHRVFDLSYIIKLLNPDFLIDNFSLVDDNNRFRENIPLNDMDVRNNFNCKYGCGIFELTKRQA